MSPDRDAYGARVWAALEAQPGFNEGMREAERQLAAGQGIRYEVKGGRLVRSPRPVRPTGNPRPRPEGER